MHSYREAFEDDDADSFANSPAFGGGGGEISPQTPSFPVSPQTPYFNMCRFTLPADRGRYLNLQTLTIDMNYSLFSFTLILECNFSFYQRCPKSAHQGPILFLI